MNVIKDSKQIDKILNRGVISQVIPQFDDFREQLLTGRRLRFYIGADPTATNLHLSHAKNYLLLEEFRQLGHEVIVLFGDFTARIGDPTEKATTRSQLTREQVGKNVKLWLEQIQPLLDFKAKENPPQIKYNSEWLSKLSLEDVVSLGANFTVQQMLERDMFEQRIANKQPVYLHEFLYPLMQGFDSVAMDVDVELCGTDQIFNALAGRTLSKRLNHKNKLVVAVNLMENPKTGELMSKSRGTGVFLGGTATEMYGAIMAQPDEMIEIFLVNNTRLPLDEIKQLHIDTNPRQAKARAALEIVTIFYGKKIAEEAQSAFVAQFQQGAIPADIPTITLDHASDDTVEIMLRTGLIKSKSAGRRLMDQGGFWVNGEKYDQPQITLCNNDVVQAGKRRFVRVKIS